MLRAPYFMPLLLLLLLLSLPHTQATFPRDPLPLLISDLQGTSPLSWFRGLEEDAVVAELGLGLPEIPDLEPDLASGCPYLTWRSQDMENCAVRGKLTDECYNYIRVLVPWDSQTLLACGTNSFSPVCRSYGITSLQQEGEELSGQARCPFDATQSNVAVFAEGSLYSATAADFQASDAVVYRSLGPQPHSAQPSTTPSGSESHTLSMPWSMETMSTSSSERSLWRTPGWGGYSFSRVARVCKRDMGGSPRALDRHWTSFLKLRLNCSVPGDAAFYFDVLQALTGPVNLYGRPALFGVFSTQTNSIPGSAVCAFYLDDIERGFEGKFKEQRSSDGAWTPVSEDRVPSPRPGSCAGVGVAALFPSSRDLPDDVLTFIKAHPLLDPTVPPATHQPLLTLTSRALLTQVAVDGTAGPYSNTTVLFLGSNDGTVLKVLPPGGPSGGREPILLEEINAYSPSRCSGKRAAQTARQVIGLELDTEGHRLFVAFSGCIIYLPLSRCARHGACRRTDVDPAGNQESMEHGDCQDGATGSQSGTGNSAYVLLGPGPSPETPSPPSEAHPRPQSSTLGAHTQGVRSDLPAASASRSVPIPLLLACSPAFWSPALVAAPTDIGARTWRPRGSRAPSPSAAWPGCTGRARAAAAALQGGRPRADAPALHHFPASSRGRVPAGPGLPAHPGVHARAARQAPPPRRGPWEWNQNGNNAKEAPGPARGNAAGGSAPRVLVRPPPRGCPGQAVEVTTLEELLRYLHAPQPARRGAEPLGPLTPRALPLEPAPAPTLLAGSSLLPRERAPPLRLDVPPDGQARCPLAGRSPLPGWGRRLPFSSHRAPPTLLTRVPSGGPSRYSGRHLYLGRPEGYRGRTLKRVDMEKPSCPRSCPRSRPPPRWPSPAAAILTCKGSRSAAAASADWSPRLGHPSRVPHLRPSRTQPPGPGPPRAYLLTVFPAVPSGEEWEARSLPLSEPAFLEGLRSPTPPPQPSCLNSPLGASSLDWAPGGPQADGRTDGAGATHVVY
ncbi:hypothetical protein QTO34_011241 [Cnephaeus nilssonii]|uniref:Sema domain-containing protein n=1 Tax=Cnephaeus nilssonii TaxID=3371016 RepID=A0AA40HD45_CNENI|nr:hypothetical protein QTO34_011241 [Eptesicus nilssonii]